MQQPMPNPKDITDPTTAMNMNPGVQNVRNQNGRIVVPGIANHNGNGNVVAAQAEGNVNGNNGNRTTNLYTINLHDMAFASLICLMARATSTKSWLWHQRLSHLNFDTINDLAKNNLVTGLPKFKYHKEHLCPSSKQ
ncbi:retrovirus-related pol polyprotein from transposon TNT 1-94 [Tanacetum coccineum]